MSQFLKQAEEILDVAAAADSGLQAILVIDRQGAIRMLDGAGWSLQAACAEFGAAAAFRIERRLSRVSVEGWNGADRCFLERSSRPFKITGLPGARSMPHPVMLQLSAGSAA